MLVKLYLILNVVLVGQSCPSRCSCSGTTVDCGSRGIATLDSLQNVATNTTDLLLSSNRISIIGSNAIMHLTNLITLDLSQNGISIIGRNAFLNLTNLTTLDLHNNRISTIESHAFLNLPSLTILDLHNNRISTIESHAFLNLPSLTTLDLYDNKISIIESYDFLNLPNLTTLHLGHLYKNACIAAKALQQGKLKVFYTCRNHGRGTYGRECEQENETTEDKFMIPFIVTAIVLLIVISLNFAKWCIRNNMTGNAQIVNDVLEDQLTNDSSHRSHTLLVANETSSTNAHYDHLQHDSHQSSGTTKPNQAGCSKIIYEVIPEDVLHNRQRKLEINKILPTNDSYEELQPFDLQEYATIKPQQGDNFKRTDKMIPDDVSHENHTALKINETLSTNNIYSELQHFEREEYENIEQEEDDNTKIDYEVLPENESNTTLKVIETSI